MEKPEPRKNVDGFLSSSMDRISDLPEPILRHILRFLPPNQAAQTSVISRSWRHLWCTRPIIELRENEVNKDRRFQTILNEVLQRYSHQNSSINQFIVEARNTWDLNLLLNKWIPIVLSNHRVEIFHLTLFDHIGYNYLPSAPVVFGAESLKELYLGRIKIKPFDYDLGLYHLQTLSLFRVYIEDEDFEEIMECCPLIQSLDLCQCEGLTTVEVYNDIKHFGCLSSATEIEIEVPSTLETIKIKSCPNLCQNLYHINNHHFPRLKSLHLSSVQLSEEFSDIFSCNSPCLEDLKLIGCRGFKQVKILSHSVKRLIIMGTDDQIQIITVDTPGILYFELSTYSSVPSISFATVTSREWKSYISVSVLREISNNDISLWFIKLLEAVKALRKSRITLDLLPYNRMNQRHLQGIDHVGYHEPVVVECLDLGLFVSFDEFSAMCNCLFRFFRPRYVHMMVYPNLQSLEDNELAGFISKANLKDGEFSQYCFWKQELKEIRLELLDDDTKRWCLVQGPMLPVIASSDNQERRSIRFIFDWGVSNACVDIELES